MIAIGWSSGFIQSSTSNAYNLVFVNYTGGQSVRKSWVAKSGQGCKCKFPVSYNLIVPTNWARSGTHGTQPGLPDLYSIYPLVP